jgi:hypothetical protein
MKAIHSTSSVILHGSIAKASGVVANMTTGRSPMQRYEDVRALLTFQEPCVNILIINWIQTPMLTITRQDVEANELKWQSFLKARHESYPAFSPQTKEITPEPDCSRSPQFLPLLKAPVKDTNSGNTIELHLHNVLASDCSPATLQTQFRKELDILLSIGKELEDRSPKKESQYLQFIEDVLSLSAFYLSFTHLETKGSELADLLKQALWFVPSLSSSLVLSS